MLSLITGIGVGSFSLGTPTVSAQAQVDCPLGDCDFTCSNLSDDWTTNMGYGVWAIVHAKPVVTGTLSALVWRDTTTGGGKSYPRMEVLGLWRAASDGSTLTASVLLNDNGSCNESGDSLDLIRCHGDVASDPNHLCDSYSGIWNQTSASGVVANCYTEYNLGYDFRKEFQHSNGKTYCFQSVTVTAKKPNNADNTNPGLKARNDCTTLSNRSWGRENAVVYSTCQAYEEQRPGGSVDRLDITLHYIYR
jgi:hypothetical protein